MARTSQASSEPRRAGALPAVSLFAALLLIAPGCGFPLRAFRSDAGAERMQRVAVLPLDNYTRSEYAGEKIRDLVNAAYLSRGIDAVESGEVARALKEIKTPSGAWASAADIRALAAALGADLVVSGAVSAYGVSKGIAVSYPEVTVSLIVHDGKTGALLRSAWRTSEGPSFRTRHFGAEGPTVSETAAHVVQEEIDILLSGKP